MGVEVHARAAARVVSRSLAALCAVGALALVAASGAAAAGKPITAGTPFASGPPAVAVNSAGDAIVAWANTKDLGGKNNFVQFCVLPPGATACAHQGDLMLADQAQYIDGTQVIADGSVIVILADVFGAQGNAAGSYEPEQEWQSTDGGATFSLVNGGLSVTSANLSADTGPLNAVIVPGTGVLGYGWETAAGPPTFNAFPLAAPPECSKDHPCPFATLEPNTNPDVLTNGGGQFAAQAGAAPGVLGVFTTLFNDGGPFSCPAATPDGIAFAYGSGNQSAGNSYDVSPGSAGSAWRGPATQGECGVERVAVAGGPAGFGILAKNEAHGTTVYQQFNQTTMTFGAPVTLSTQSELYPALSEDAAGGLYATYLNSGAGGPIALSYSPDGGKTWSGPGTLDSYAGQADVTSAVGPTGQGWATWTANGSVFAQSFTATDAITPPNAGGGSTDGQTVSLNVSCTSYPCTITITLTAPEAVVVHASSARVPERKGKRRTRRVTVTLATGRARLTRGGKVTLRLSGAGRRFVKSRSGHLKVTAKLTEKFGRFSVPRQRTIILRITPHHRK